MKMLMCDVYKSTKTDETYLYLESGNSVNGLPESLQEIFGKPKWVMKLLLKEDTQLARAKVIEVIKDIHAKGFYLQLPPAKDSYLLDLYPKPLAYKSTLNVH